jgi:DNA-binding CsgD family transcriptional regulator
LSVPSHVEHFLAACNLPRRQVEVCARILLGFSRDEISNDLGIGVETVQTHRKRAYCRLHVASDREFASWFADVNRQSKSLARTGRSNLRIAGNAVDTRST